MRGLVWILMVGMAVGAQAATDMHRLVWNDDPATTISVAWRQQSGSAKVYYDVVDHGTNVSAYAMQQSTSSTNNHLGLQTHIARLQGLKPDTAYYLLIADADSISRRYWFQTAPNKAADFTFIAGGDTKSKDNKPGKKPPMAGIEGSFYERGRKSNRMVAKLRPLFVLFVGDFTSDSNKPHRWVDWFNDWNNDTCSADGRMYPLIPVHGNHENPNGLTDLKYLFDTPESVYYTIDFCGDFMRLFVLNTELSSHKLLRKVSDMDARWEEQTRWLETTLEASGDFAYRAAMYHKPFRPHIRRKSPEKIEQTWAPLFAKHKLNLSFDGDSHMHKITYPLVPDPSGEEGFRRDDVNGTMYIGEGSWGAGPRPAHRVREWTLSHASINQFKWVQVRDNAFHIRTVNTANEADVAALAPGHEFDVPEKIDLLEVKGLGTVVKYPFHLNGLVD